MNFVADEDFPLESALLLREAGFEVMSIVETTQGLGDAMVLGVARDSHAVLLTFDRDFGELVYRRNIPPPRGLVYFRLQPSTPGEPAEILLNMIKSGRFPLEGNFTIIKRNLIRQRALTRR